MKQPMYMTGRELIETFGKGPKGKRRVTSEMIRWLLTCPNDEALLLASITKETPDLSYEYKPPANIIHRVAFNFATVDQPTFNFGTFS